MFLLCFVLLLLLLLLVLFLAFRAFQGTSFCQFILLVDVFTFCLVLGG